MNRRAKGLKSSSRNENTRTENTKNTGDRYISVIPQLIPEFK